MGYRQASESSFCSANVSGAARARLASGRIEWHWQLMSDGNHMGATTRRVPLNDLVRQNRQLQAELVAGARDVIERGWFVLGSQCDAFEREFAAYCGSAYCIGAANGTDAIELALRAAGVSPGDRVATVANAGYYSSTAIHAIGAVPVYVDVATETYLISIPSLVRAVVVTHLYGGLADIEAIVAICKPLGVPVIEDCAQAHGASRGGRKAGSFGAAGCFSFYPTKNLGAFGDGGLCTTNDPEIAARLRALRVHGRTGTYFHEWVGMASRLDAIQAAVLAVKLKYLDTWSDGRARNAALYVELLERQDVPVIAPRAAAYQTRHIYHQFVIRCRKRDELQAYLKAHGIGCEVYYPLSLHQQPCFADLGYSAGDFPVSEELAQTCLALPIHSDLSGEQIEYAVSAIRSFYAA
jgi:dTDP-4-amino-4,6-dideoxygalactose transaminase